MTKPETLKGIRETSSFKYFIGPLVDIEQRVITKSYV